MKSGDFSSALIIPKDDSRLDRATKVQPRNRGLVLFDAEEGRSLKTSVNVALKRLSLSLDEDREAFDKLRDGSANTVTKSLARLDTTMLWSRDDDAIDEIRHRLRADFDVVPNFDLSLPASGARATEHAQRQYRTTAVKADKEMWRVSGIEEARANNNRGDNVFAGILDTGIDADHAEFKGRLVKFRHVGFFPQNGYAPSRDVRGFDTDGHGTHVAGILCGKKLGVAPGVDLHCASVIESETMHTSMVRIAYGLNWLLQNFINDANGLKPAIINLSLGFPDKDDADNARHRLRVETIHKFVRTLVAADMMVVSAVGNDGSGVYSFPAGFPEVIAVGAVDPYGIVADFSGSTPIGTEPAKPDFYGFGHKVLSSIERNHVNQSLFTRLSGTSMAAPYVAGIASLYRSAFPTWSVADIIDVMKSSAIPLDGQTAGLATYHHMNP